MNSARPRVIIERSIRERLRESWTEATSLLSLLAVSFVSWTPLTAGGARVRRCYGSYA